MFITKFSVPSIITYLGAAVAVAGIYLANQNIELSILCLFIATFFDFFDGKFARKFKRSTQEMKFGIAIDSLVDVIAFIALPIIILFNLTSFNIAILIIAIIYTLSGITRLAVFTSEAKSGEKTLYYRGLPITFAGLVIPLTYIIISYIDNLNVVLTLSLVYLVLSFLFILNIKVKKI